MRSIRLLPLILLGFVPVVLAEDNIPPTNNSLDVIEQQIVKDSREEVLEEKKSAPPIVQSPSPKKPKSSASFKLSNVHLTGDEVVPFELFDPILNQYENREVTLEDLNILMRQLEEQYRFKGYIATVVIAPQKIKNGEELILRAYLSTMGKLQIEGGRYYPEWGLRRYWNIPAGQPLKYDKLERTILAMNENPDRMVRSYLKQGEEPQTIDVYLKVEEHFPLHAGYSFDNRGVKLTGKNRHGFTLRHNNLLKLDDIFLVGTAFGHSFGALFVQHLIPLNSYGTRLVWGFTHAQVTPQKELERFGINGISQTYTLMIRQRIFRNLRQSLDTYLGFDIKEKTTRVLNTTSNWDRLRVLTLGFEYSLRDSLGIWALGKHFSAGLPLHGNGFPLNSRQGETQFYKYSFSLQRQQKLPWDLKGIAKFEAQLTNSRLLPQEQMFLGGVTSVRGYAEGDYAADQALQTNFELWLPLYGVPKDYHLPRSSIPLRDQLNGLLFLDYGYGMVHDPMEGDRRSRTLLGVGAGLSFKWSKYFAIRTEWGVPLGDEGIIESGPTQFHFRITADV